MFNLSIGGLWVGPITFMVYNAGVLTTLAVRRYGRLEGVLCGTGVAVGSAPKVVRTIGRSRGSTDCRFHGTESGLGCWQVIIRGAASGTCRVTSDGEQTLLTRVQLSPS